MAGSERNKIVVICYLHLGIDDECSETVANRPLLVEFLQRLQSTSDVRELVIAGDFLDEWFLPVYYPSFTDEAQFYKDVIANNHDVIYELNNVADSGISLVYVPGNHDMTLEAEILQEAIPKIEQMRDAEGLGYYYTGDRHEIAIEYGHRYDVFSEPVLFKNIQRTWAQRQEINRVRIAYNFVEAVVGAVDYHFQQAKTQYLENPIKISTLWYSVTPICPH